MRIKFLGLVPVALLCGSLVAHADTIEQFSINAVGGVYLGVVPDPAPGPLLVTGTCTIDTTLGTFLGGDVLVDLNGTVTELSIVHFTNPDSPGKGPAAIELLSGTAVTSFPFLQFDVAVPASLVGYTGGALCSNTNQDGDCLSQGSGLIDTTGQDAHGTYQGFFQVVNGTLTPLASNVTPEP